MDTDRDADVNVNHAVSREKETELEKAACGKNMPEVTNLENVEGKAAE